MGRPSELSLEELMVAMQRGDQGASKELLKAVRAIAIVVARKALNANRIKDESLVEDIAQDALLAVHTKRHTYDPAQPFLPWVTAITRYKAIDRLRKSRIKFTVALDATNDDVAAEASDPTAAVDVERLLQTLSPKVRRAVELVKLEGLSSAAAADQLGLNESTLKVTVHRALLRLRASLRNGP